MERSVSRRHQPAGERAANPSGSLPNVRTRLSSVRTRPGSRTACGTGLLVGPPGALGCGGATSVGVACATRAWKVTRHAPASLRAPLSGPSLFRPRRTNFVVQAALPVPAAVAGFGRRTHPPRQRRSAAGGRVNASRCLFACFGLSDVSLLPSPARSGARSGAGSTAGDVPSDGGRIHRCG